MKHSAIRSRVAAVVLGATLITPGVWAAESRAERALERPVPAPKIVFLTLWDFLTALWDEDGAFIDPYGGKALSPEPALTTGGDLSDEGFIIDPYG